MRLLNLEKDEKQAQALLHLEGACIYSGCNGSGKSSLILSRAHMLIAEKQVNPRSILVICSDDQAMKLSKSTYQMLVYDEEAPIFSTMDRLCAKIVLAYEKSINVEPLKIYRNMCKSVKNICLDAFGKNLNDDQLMEIMDQLNKSYSMMMNETEIKKIQMDGIDFGFLINAMNKVKNKQKIRDLNDVKLTLLQLLQSKPGLLKLLDLDVEYLMFDDAQNLTFIDHMLIKALSEGHNNLFFTCNEAACFAEKRGAYPNALKTLKDVYQDVVTLENNINYRSSKSIVDYSLKLNELKTNKLVMTAANTEEIPCAFKAFKDKIQMDDYVLKVCDFTKQLGFIYRDMASVIPLMDTLILQNIPFRLNGSISEFFENDLFVELCAFLKVIKNPKDIDSFGVIYDKMGLNLTETQFHNIENLMHLKQDVDLYQAMMTSSLKNAQKAKLVSRLELIRFAQNTSMEQCLDYILNDFGYSEYLKMRTINEDHPIISTLKIMCNRYSDEETLWERLTAIEEHELSISSSVVLASLDKIHGCEFDEVFVLDCVNSIFPKVNKEHEDYELEVDRFIYILNRAIHHFELLSYKSVCSRRVKMSDFMYTLCAKEEAEVKEVTVSTTELKLARGNVIIHKNFGQGTIINITGGKMRVAFESEEKVLSVAHCQANQMIEIVK